MWGGVGLAGHGWHPGAAAAAAAVAVTGQPGHLDVESCCLRWGPARPSAVPDVDRHVAGGGKPWDTIKPLGLFFRRAQGRRQRGLVLHPSAARTSHAPPPPARPPLPPPMEKGKADGTLFPTSTLAGACTGWWW